MLNISELLMWFSYANIASRNALLLLEFLASLLRIAQRIVPVNREKTMISIICIVARYFNI